MDFEWEHSPLLSSPPSPAPPPSQEPLHVCQEPVAAPAMQHQLRPLPIPSFEGDVASFPSFWERFCIAVHDAPIPAVHKLIHLQSAVKGEAAALVNKYPTIGANYETAVRALKDRFGSSETITEALWDQLSSLRPLGPRSSFGDIKNFIDEVEAVASQLELQGVSLDHHNNVARELLRKLPPYIAKIFTSKLTTESWSFDALREIGSAYIKTQLQYQSLYNKQEDKSLPVVGESSRQSQGGGQRQGGGDSDRAPQRQQRGQQRPQPHPRQRQQGAGPPQSSDVARPHQQARKQPGRQEGGRQTSSENSGSFSSYPSGPRSSNGGGTYTKVKSSSSSANGPASTQASRNGSCFYCDGNHSPEQCQNYDSATKRYTRLLYLRRCIKCGHDGHFARQCQAGQCRLCQGHHHYSLCRGESASSVSAMTSATTGKEAEEALSQAITNTATIEKKEGQKITFLPTAKVTIVNPADETKIATVTAMLDSCSNLTFINEKLSKKLGFPSQNSWLSIRRLMDETAQHVPSSVVDLELILIDGTKLEITANAIKSVNGKLNKPALQEEVVKALEPYKRCLADDLPDKVSTFEPMLLIGQDFLGEVEINKPCQKLQQGLKLKPTRLGLVLEGVTEAPPSSEGTTPPASCLTMATTTDVLSGASVEFVEPDRPLNVNTLFDKFFSLESLGIRDNINDNDDDVALQLFYDNLEFRDGRFQVRFPWKSGELKLGDNQGLAYGRWLRQKQKLEQNEAFKLKACQIIIDQLNKGFIEKVNDANHIEGEHLYYLPSQFVIRDSETTDCRMVFDASSKTRKSDMSLNDCLYKGPSFIASIPGSLCRFRLSPFVSLCDIEKAFHMVSLSLRDRDACRFYFYNDPINPNGHNDGIYRWAVIPFGVISSPFQQQACTLFHLQKKDSELAKELVNNQYCDNYHFGANSADDLIQKYKESKEIFGEIGMNLRQYCSNNNKFNDSLPEKDKAKSSIVKVLGMLWDTETDKLMVKNVNTVNSSHNTKRSCARDICAPFDPNGLLLPVCVPLRCFMQKLWELKMEWDEPLPSELEAEWQELRHRLSHLEDIGRPRWIGSITSNHIWELHCFGDASTRGFGAVAYARRKDDDSFFLLFSKFRVRPKGENRIPRLELLALELASQICGFIKRELDEKFNFASSTLYTDSRCVLCWVRFPRPRCVFVDNRVKSIKRENASIQYVPTSINPADVLSRGCDIDELQTHQLWWQGPNPVELEKHAEDMPDSDETEDEETMNKDSTATTETSVAMATTTTVDETTTSPPHLSLLGIDYNRFSSYDKLCRTLVIAFRFLSKCRSNVGNDEVDDSFYGLFNQCGHITLNEIRIVETFLLRNMQEEAFPELQEELPPAQWSSGSKALHHNLGLMKDQKGLLRCRGRLGKAELPELQRFPILLPRQHYVSTLLVRKVHEQMCHASVEATLTHLRRKYWLPQGRSLVKSIIRRCVICRRAEGGPFQWQPMPDLPVSRLQRQRPFFHTGCDHLGPVYVNNGDGFQKVYGVIFTCMTVRCLHLELVPSLSAASFLKAFRRFIARRGRPALVLSDGAGAFQTTKAVLDKLSTTAMPPMDSAVKNYCLNERIEWQFRPPNAPWQHGFYERLIADVKEALQKALWKQPITTEDLETLLVEIEAMLNARPLTYNAAEAETWVLTPADFLMTTAGGIASPADEEPDIKKGKGKKGRDQLFDALKLRLQLLDDFWRLFYDRYLPCLRAKQRMSKENPRNSVPREPQPGEVVLIGNQNVPRGQWDVAKVEATVPSKDGKVRLARLRTETLKGLVKPVNMLYPLEVAAIEEEDEEEESEMSETNVNTTTTMATTADKTTKVTTTGSTTSSSTTKGFARIKKINGGPWCWLALLCMMLFPLSTFAASTTAQCKVKTEDLTRLPYSHRCRQKGVVLFEDKQGFLCYNNVDCGTGVLDGEGQCKSSQLCTCPAWSSDCTFTGGPPPLYGNILEESKRKSALEAAEPNVCSWEPGQTGCSKEASYGKFAQVQTYDGKLYVVNSLQIQLRENNGDNKLHSFTCYGAGSSSGTEEYCQQFPCQAYPTRLCFYYDNEFAVLKLQEGEIPVVAWGYVPKAYYGLKSVPKQTPICTNCHIKCVKGGVEVQLNEGMGSFEACSGPFCYDIKQPQTETKIFFPAEVTIHEYQVVVKVHSNGYLVRDFGKSCPASPFCELIECSLCLTMLYNPQCAPKYALLTLFIFIYFGSMSLYVLSKLLKMLLSFIYQGASCVKFVCEALQHLPQRLRQGTQRHRRHRRHSSSESDERESRSSKKRRGPRLPEMMVLMAILGLPNVNGCSDVASLMADRSSCSVGANKELHCAITQATRLALVPQGQDTCLMVKDPNGEPLGTLLLEVQRLAVKCATKNEYYTRSFRMNTDASKRCPWKGECNGDRCGKVGVNDHLSDLSSAANGAPGFSGCFESCGCWGCSCFSCASACLFYRTFAVPITFTVYEVFTCPTWTYQAQLRARLLVQDQSAQDHIFHLSPAIPQTWNKMRLTLIASTTAKVPFLGSQFLTDGSRTIITRTSASGQPVAGTLGQMQCANKANAANFKCYLASDICRCGPADDSVHCDCNEQNLESLFGKEDVLLPFTTNGITLTTGSSGNQLLATFEDQASLEIQVEMEGMRLSSKIEKNKCKVSQVSCSGCYSCLSGAKMTHTCTTDFGEALAHITCGGASFSTLCTASGTTSTSTLQFQQAQINEQCEVVCPAGSSTFELKTTLVFVMKERLFNITSMSAKGPGSSQSSLPDLGFLGGYLSGNAIISIIAIVIAIVLACLSIPLIYYCVTQISLLKINENPFRSLWLKYRNWFSGLKRRKNKEMPRNLENKMKRV